METLRWLRVVGDTIFAVGIIAVGWFVLGLKTGWSLRSEPEHSINETITRREPVEA